MDCKGRKLIFYCKSFWGNMFGDFWGQRKANKNNFLQE
jgi:hypothetical protein